ncbi:C5a peptidase [Plasmodiophora brassicae]
MTARARRRGLAAIVALACAVRAGWLLPGLEHAHLQDWDVPRPSRSSRPPCRPNAPRVAVVVKMPADTEYMGRSVSHGGCSLGEYVAPNAFVVRQCPQWKALIVAMGLVDRGIAHAVICLPERRTIESEAATKSNETRFRTLNLYSKYITQSGAHRTVPMWDQGLTGSGQIVAVADTGLDHDLCYFHDPNHPTPIENVNLDHRKVVVYRVLPRGLPPSPDTRHGTHTAGSVAGEVLHTSKLVSSQMSQFNGMAKHARLAVYDLGPKSNIRIPGNLYKDLYEIIVADTDAKISSNSWGAPLEVDSDGIYDQYALATDKFVWDHQDFLILFGAGNWGLTASRPSSTIGTPAIAKNALTVGSATSYAESFRDAHVIPHAFLQVVEPQQRPGVTGLHSIIQATFGSDVLGLEPIPRPVCPADPFDACTPLVNTNDTRSALVLVGASSGGGCNAVVKALHVQQAAGAAILIVASHEGNEPITGTGLDVESVTIPVLGIDRDLGRNLQSVVELSPVKVLVPAYDASLKEKRNLGYVSDFSSRGPTFDGRIKPDILAPGEYIMSAKSDMNLNSFQCDPTQYSSMKGTSMATPIAAGNVAQIRQYFVDGYYPSGRANPADAIRSPSAALLKAMAINSGVTMTGWVVSLNAGPINVDPPPSTLQGYGRMQLDRILPLAPATFQLVVSDNRSMVTGDHHHFCFRVRPSDRPFKASLVWTDPPPDLDADYLLINNLDLIVTSIPTGALWIGNLRDSIIADNSTRLHTFMDAMNNVEQVDVGPDQDGLFDVMVSGTHVVVGPQPYALVVTGTFDLEPLSSCRSTRTVCPDNCSQGQGFCTADGLCQCHAGFAGFDCSYASTSVKGRPGAIQTSRVDVGQWQFYHFDVVDQVAPADDLAFGSQTTCVLVTVSTTGSAPNADPELFMSFGEMPSLTTAQWSNRSRTFPSTIVVRGTPTLHLGRYYIGVHGGCCQPASFQLTVSDSCGPMVTGLRQAGAELFKGTATLSVGQVVVIVMLVTAIVAAIAVIIVRLLIEQPNKYRQIQLAHPATTGLDG